MCGDVGGVAGGALLGAGDGRGRAAAHGASTSVLSTCMHCTIYTAHLLHRNVCLSPSLTGIPSPRERQQTRSGSSEAALKVRRLQARLSTKATNLGSSSQRLRKEGAGAGAKARDPTCGVTLPGPDEYFPGE